MQDLRDRNIAQFVRRKKRGPFKCPDFFAVDPQNRVHLIECKGNQRGLTDIDRQFQRGREQKQNVWFRNEALVGQRLLTGIAIAGANSNWSSTLRLADPTPDRGIGYYEIDTASAIPLIESFKRVVVVQGLISAGALRIAHLLFPKETDTDKVRFVREPPITQFVAQNNRWTGRVYELSFPLPINLEDRSSIAGCRLRFGAGEGFLDELNTKAGLGRGEDILQQKDLDVRLHTDPDRNKERRSRKSFEGERRGNYAAIQHGDALIADMELLEA